MKISLLKVDRSDGCGHLVIVKDCSYRFEFEAYDFVGSESGHYVFTDTGLRNQISTNLDDDAILQEINKLIQDGLKPEFSVLIIPHNLDVRLYTEEICLDWNEDLRHVEQVIDAAKKFVEVTNGAKNDEP